MKENKIFLIIGREFSIRVKKKSFIIMTILAPLLFASMMIIPTLMMTMSDDNNDIVNINVVDESGIVMPYLVSNKDYAFKQISKTDLDDFKKYYLNHSEKLENEDVYLYISELDSANNVNLQTFSNKPVKMSVTSYLRVMTKNAVENYKIKLLNIPDIRNIVNSLNTKVGVSSFEVDSEGKTKRSENTVYMIIGYITGFMIYMFIFMFGSMVMKSVIEEKTTRIIEVIISSVKPFQLMIGKIIGVACVALTQFFIWIILTLLLVYVGGSIAGVNMIGGNMSTMVPGNMPIPNMGSGVNSFMSALYGVDFVYIIGIFLIYFILGYLLYSSMFAAVGSAVDAETDTQQLIFPITLPLIIGLFIMIRAFQYPDTSLVIWASIIPFTSPMVMMARIPYGVPLWQLLTSISLLVVTFIICTYISTKIYRIGILMYGKKFTWKDIIKWLRY